MSFGVLVLRSLLWLLDRGWLLIADVGSYCGVYGSVYGLG